MDAAQTNPGQWFLHSETPVSAAPASAVLRELHLSAASVGPVHNSGCLLLFLLDQKRGLGMPLELN